jgi:hypothetical protein
MEQRLNDILRGLEIINDKPLYDLLLIESKKSNNDSISIKRRYAKLSFDNSVKYFVNPKYFENKKKLRMAVYSIIKSAFKEYRYSEKENIEILLNDNSYLNKVKGVKKELEEAYSLMGTDAGFYEVPFLGNALQFSVQKLAVRSVNNSVLKEYI